MTQFLLCSDHNKALQIGDVNNSSAIVQNETYQVCHFPGATFRRHLTFTNLVTFSQSEDNTVDFVNESGDVVFTFNTGDTSKAENQVQEISVTVDVPATNLPTQTLSIQWKDKGGAFQAVFSGNVLIYDATESVTWG